MMDDYLKVPHHFAIQFNFMKLSVTKSQRTWPFLLNYRLSQGRRITYKNAIGILAPRYHIFVKPIHVDSISNHCLLRSSFMKISINENQHLFPPIDG